MFLNHLAQGMTTHQRDSQDALSIPELSNEISRKRGLSLVPLFLRCGYSTP
jgi:hypothetical protein